MGLLEVTIACLFMGFLGMTVKKTMATVQSVEPRLWAFCLLKGQRQPPHL